MEWKPGKEMMIADHLSRASINDDQNSIEILNELVEIDYNQCLPMSKEKFREFQEAGREDEVLQ